MLLVKKLLITKITNKTIIKRGSNIHISPRNNILVRLKFIEIIHNLPYILWSHFDICDTKSVVDPKMHHSSNSILDHCL